MYVYRQIEPQVIAVRWPHSQLSRDAAGWVEIRQMPGVVGPLDGLLQYHPKLHEKLLVYDALGRLLLIAPAGYSVLERLRKLVTSTQFAHLAILVRVRKEPDGLFADIFRLTPGCIGQAMEIANEVGKLDAWLDATWRKPR